LSIALNCIDPDWVSPRSDLIDNFPERSIYPAAPLIRNKRIAIDGLTKNALDNSQSQIFKYVDPIFAELNIGKRSNHILITKYPNVQLVNENKMVDNTIDSQIKSISTSRPKDNLLNPEHR